MKALLSFALSAVLALQAHVVVAASHARRSLTKAPQRMWVHRPAHRAGGYYVPYVRDASGAQVPIMQIPGSVVVISHQVIQDQQDITVCDALRNVSGISCR